MAIRIDESLTEQISMSDVFYGGGGKKQLDVFFSAKKAVDERWEVRGALSTSSSATLRRVRHCLCRKKLWTFRTFRTSEVYFLCISMQVV